MADIFISYVEEDADVVELLVQGLTEAGYSCWHYRESSLPGASYLQQISEALSQAQVVLLVLSPQTLDSFQVDKEISFAHECNKPFLPITRDLAWGELQQRRPTWRLAIGTTVALPMPAGGIAADLPGILQGLRSLRVTPAVGASDVPGDPAAVAVDQMPTAGSASGLTPRRVGGIPTSAAPVVLPGSLPNRTAFVGRAAELDFLRAQ